MTKLTIAFIVALLSVTSTYGETFNYSCNACLFPRLDDGDGCDVVIGKTYPLRVDDSKNILEWRGKKYSITVSEECGKYGWQAEGNGAKFNFCTATQGYGAIEDNDGVKVRCNIKK